MIHSKLELYIDILKVLEHNGPLTIAQIMNNANIKGTILREQIDFLIKQYLIVKRTVKKNRTVFAVTQSGANVLGYFTEFAQTLSIAEEALS